MADTSNARSLRLFFGLWPDDATRAALMQLQAPMRGQLVPYANLHLTLAFLGQQPDSRLPMLEDILKRLPVSSITLRLDRAGYFPRNRIAWVGMHEVPQVLLTLQQELMKSLAERNIMRDTEQDFTPHITLARNASLPPDIVFAPIVWHADQIALVQSVTSSAGSQYQVLASRSLAQQVWNTGIAGEDGDDAPDER